MWCKLPVELKLLILEKVDPISLFNLSGFEMPSSVELRKKKRFLEYHSYLDALFDALLEHEWEIVSWLTDKKFNIDEYVKMLNELLKKKENNQVKEFSVVMIFFDRCNCYYYTSENRISVYTSILDKYKYVVKSVIKVEFMKNDIIVGNFLID